MVVVTPDQASKKRSNKDLISESIRKFSISPYFELFAVACLSIFNFVELVHRNPQIWCMDLCISGQN